MEVMAIYAVGRLVTPRLWAAASVGVLLVSMVIVGGVGGGFFFTVIVQGVSPGAFFNGATALVRMSDLVVARSEEHTSELQSLMRISYAVFCLKKNII